MIQTNNIYLDNAAATALSDSMQKYLVSLLKVYGNPSSIHSAGKQSKQILSDARQSVATFLHASPDDLYFTPSGAASNTWAVKGLTSGNSRCHAYQVFFSPTAHKSMRQACESCLYHTPLKVSSTGTIDLSYLNNILAKQNGWKPLVCIEAANSEIGTIQDVLQIGAIVHNHHGIFVLDATGYLPSFPVNMDRWKKYVDILTCSGHKLHSLKGVGILWKRKEIIMKPFIYGSQQQGLIGGTENVLGIASLGKAVKEYDYASISSAHRDYLYEYIIQNIPDSYLVGASFASGNRLPHNLFMCFQGVEGDSLMMMLDQNGIQVSTGSACNSGNLSASATLSAIGMKDDDLHSCIRFTFSGTETKEELDYVCQKLKECIHHLRELNKLNINNINEHENVHFKQI